MHQQRQRQVTITELLQFVIQWSICVLAAILEAQLAPVRCDAVASWDSVEAQAYFQAFATALAVPPFQCCLHLFSVDTYGKLQQRLGNVRGGVYCLGGGSSARGGCGTDYRCSPHLHAQFALEHDQ